MTKKSMKKSMRSTNKRIMKLYNEADQMMMLTLIADPLGDNVNIVLVSGEQVGAIDELLRV